MALLTKVKAGSVSSLSDARYFSGMGVDWLGFDVNPDSPDYVSLDLYKSMVGWVSGPLRVLELADGMVGQIQHLESDYMPHALEVSYDDFAVAKTVSKLDIMVRLDADIAQPAPSLLSGASYVIVRTSQPLQRKQWIDQLAEVTQVLLHIEPNQPQWKELLTLLPIAGINLSGSPETQVGVKEYGYADLLESLEID